VGPGAADDFTDGLAALLDSRAEEARDAAAGTPQLISGITMLAVWCYLW
jgi:hypothetical protein